MRNRYIVAYDIREPKRLYRVAKKMIGFGDRIQYSVFMCDLSEKELVILETELTGIIKLSEDSILIINLGAPSGRTSSNVKVLGQASLPNSSRVAIVV